MEKNNRRDLPRNLEELTSPELALLLQRETAKENPDDEFVLQLLKILKKRDASRPTELNAQQTVAWERYQARIGMRKRKFTLALIKIATTVLLVGSLIMVIPRAATSGSLWRWLVTWVSEMAEFAVGDETEYVFQTDHPGLQQIYDAVVEMGITEPVVPMWLPEEFELVECKDLSVSRGKILVTTLQSQETTMVYRVSAPCEHYSYSYYIGEAESEHYEINGFYYVIMQGDQRMTAVWFKDGIECSLVFDGDKDTMYRILESIYETEQS